MIKGWSYSVRWPRLGTIGLGERDEKGVPKSRDHFVVPPEVARVYGEKPRELDIMIPFEDDIETLDVVFPAYLKRRGEQFGLICRGTGEWAHLSAVYARKFGSEYGIVVKDGRFLDAFGRALPFEPGEDGRGWLRITCEGRSCQHYVNGKCKEEAILNVLLPKVEGVLGVYYIDTKSFWSYQNIKNSLVILKGLVGRISLIPLKLKVRMQKVHPVVGLPGDERRVKSVAPVMYIDMGAFTLENVLDLGRRGRLFATLSLPVPREVVDVEVSEVEEEEPSAVEPEPQAEAAVSEPAPPAEPPLPVQNATSEPMPLAAPQVEPLPSVQDAASEPAPPAPDEQAAVEPPEERPQTSFGVARFQALGPADKVTSRKGGVVRRSARVRAKLLDGSGKECDLWAEENDSELIAAMSELSRGDVFSAEVSRVVREGCLVVSSVRVEEAA